MKTSFWDVRTLKGLSETYLMQDGKLESLQTSILSSIGVRVLKNGAWGFASSDDLESEKKLVQKAERIAELVGQRQKEKNEFKALKPIKEQQLTRSVEDGFRIDKEEKKKLLQELEKKARKHANVKSTSFSLSITRSETNLKNSEGSRIKKEKPAIILKGLIVFRKGDNIQRSYDAITKIGGYEAVRKLDKELFIKNLCERGNRLLKAKPCPPGKHTVIIDNRLAGVFFHEAVGHACEADLHLSGSSILKELVGQRVAGQNITLKDAKRKESWGYYETDSEGVPKKDVVMIDKGVLKGLLHSRKTASRMSAEPTGNGRAMSPANNPIPRMSTTILEKGCFTKEELFRDVKKGIYLRGSMGGQVEPTKGTFVFNAEEAFAINNGEICESMRDVSLNGQTLKTLKNIDAVGKDVLIDKRGGMCGKAGQLVPVSEFCPHVRIKEVLVGGR